MTSRGGQQTQDIITYVADLNMDITPLREIKYYLILRLNKVRPDQYGLGNGVSYEPFPLSLLLCTYVLAISHPPHNRRPSGDQPILFSNILLLDSHGLRPQCLHGLLPRPRVQNNRDPNIQEILINVLRIVPLPYLPVPGGEIHLSSNGHPQYSG